MSEKKNATEIIENSLRSVENNFKQFIEVLETAKTELGKLADSAATIERLLKDYPGLPTRDEMWTRLGDARLSIKMADAMLDEGIYVIGFSYPVVPKGQARIRVQISAAHSEEQIEHAIAAFTKVGHALGVLSEVAS